MVGPNQNRMNQGPHRMQQGPRMGPKGPNPNMPRMGPGGNKMTPPRGPPPPQRTPPPNRTPPVSRPVGQSPVNKMPPPNQVGSPKGKPAGPPQSPNNSTNKPATPQTQPRPAPTTPTGQNDQSQGNHQGNNGSMNKPSNAPSQPPQQPASGGNNEQQSSGPNPMKRRFDGRGGFRGGQRGGYQNQGNRGPSPQQQQHQPPIKQEMMEDSEPLAPQPEKKFTGRCRLFVGNLPNDTKEDEFRKLFEPYGELSEVYVNVQRGFGFVRLDTRTNAEAAKAALDGLQRKGRVLRVRFATHGAALKVKHLGPFTSNELLEQAFSTFGAIERSIVIVDDRGKPTGDGIVEFARKPGAQQALTRINEGCFFLGTALRPIMVEPLEQKDEEDGLPEKFLTRNQAYLKDRELCPRFAQRGSFEYEFGMKWKELYRLEEEQKLQLQRQIEDQQARLEMEMGAAQIEHQAKLLHQDYLRKQEELKRMEESHQQEMQRRLDMRRQEEDMRRQEEERRHQEMLARQQQEEEMRRRQEERQRHHDVDMYNGPGSNSMRRDDQRDMRDRNAPMPPPPAPPAGLGIERTRGTMGNPTGLGGPMDPGLRGSPSGSLDGPGGMGGTPQRQSRFDQPPATMGSFSSMGGQSQGMGGRSTMGRPGQGMGSGNMDGNGMGGGPMGGMGGRGPMNQDRGMMQRRDQRDGDDFFENKRPRRY